MCGKVPQYSCSTGWDRRSAAPGFPGRREAAGRPHLRNEAAGVPWLDSPGSSGPVGSRVKQPEALIIEERIAIVDGHSEGIPRSDVSCPRGGPGIPVRVSENS